MKTILGGVYREGVQSDPARRYIIACNFDYIAVPARKGGWVEQKRWAGRLLGLTRLPADEAAAVLTLVGAPVEGAA